MGNLSRTTLQTYSSRLKKLPNVKKAKIAHRRGQKAFYTYLGSKAKTSGLYRSYNALFKPRVYEQVLEFQRKQVLTKRALAKRVLRGKLYKAKTTKYFASIRFERDKFKPDMELFNELYLSEVKNMFNTLFKTNASKRMFKKPLGHYGYSVIVDVKYDVYDIATHKKLGTDKAVFGRKLYADSISLKADFKNVIQNYESYFNSALRSILFVVKSIRVYIQFYELLT